MRRFWECNRCALIVITAPQDDATKFECPQCNYVKSNEIGVFEEIQIEDLRKDIGLHCVPLASY